MQTTKSRKALKNIESKRKERRESAIANLHHIYLVSGQSQFEVMPPKPVVDCYSIWRVLEINERGLWLEPIWANAMTASFISFEKWNKAIKDDKGFYSSDKALKLRRLLNVALLFHNCSFKSTIEEVFKPDFDLTIPEAYNDYFSGKWKPTIKHEQPFMG